jgi:hypothetical protein
MAEFLRDYGVLIAFAGGSLTAYLAQLIVSHFRRVKRWLGYSVTSRNIVEADHSEISVRYREEEIARLDSHGILLRNVGNVALSNIPVRIKSGSNSRILDSELSGPEGAEVIQTMVSQSELTVTCDLLNPGEAVSVGLTIADGDDGELRIFARSEGLTVKMFKNTSTTRELVELFVDSSSPLTILAEAISIISTRR